MILGLSIWCRRQVVLEQSAFREGKNSSVEEEFSKDRLYEFVFAIVAENQISFYYCQYSMTCYYYYFVKPQHSMILHHYYFDDEGSIKSWNFSMNLMTKRLRIDFEDAKASMLDRGFVHVVVGSPLATQMIRHYVQSPQKKMMVWIITFCRRPHSFDDDQEKVKKKIRKLILLMLRSIVEVVAAALKEGAAREGF